MYIALTIETGDDRTKTLVDVLNKMKTKRFEPYKIFYEESSYVIIYNIPDNVDNIEDVLNGMLNGTEVKLII